MSIAIVAGIRSHYTKIEALNRGIESLGARTYFEYIDAAQHYSKELSQNFIDDFRINFDCSLRELALPLEAAARALAIEATLKSIFKRRREIESVVVLGDSNTTLLAARAAKSCGKSVLHVEAGTRTRSNAAEERNRRLTDEISDVCIASSRTCFLNLLREGKASRSVFVGDILIDECLNALTLPSEIGIDIFVSLHHEEDWPPNFIADVYKLLGEIGLSAILLVHPKDRHKLDIAHVRHACVEITSYIDHSKLLQIIRSAKVVATDSGSIQREAHYLGSRAIVVQKHPFWSSLIAEGCNIAVSPNLRELRSAIDSSLSTRTDSCLLVEEFGSPPIAPKLAEAILSLSKGSLSGDR